jgi:pantoate--beta-alanine ligase
MQIISATAELRVRLRNETFIAFVPTMGNLHEGHLSLMRLAREQGDCVVASIFVNPLQFGPSEDFDQYPRTLEADCAKLEGLVDVVFAPSVNEMYPAQQTVFVELPPMANELCGADRPDHFRGMATVVLKLLNIVQPHVAIFGKKDYQQLQIIRQMVGQLNLPIEIVGGEIVRATDGLALSSRNQYLSDVERAEAVMLHQTLGVVQIVLQQGDDDLERLQWRCIKTLSDRGWVVDYVALRRQSDLSALAAPCGEMVLLAAAKLGKTRLLDNIEVCLNS